MNKKIIILIGSIGFILVLFFIAYWISSSYRNTDTTDTPNGNGVVTPGTNNSSTTPQANTILIQTSAGGYLRTRDFINDPLTAKDPINASYYYLGYHVYIGVTDPTATENPPYIIEYLNSTQYFNIALLQEPIGAVRVDAQKYLMTHLGVAENQLCRLKYTVSVPARVNSQFAGKNLGFSFCPGATALPL